MIAPINIEALLAKIARAGFLFMLEVSAAEHGVTREDALRRSRRNSDVAARRMFCRALKERGLSYPEIGNLIGRDHTTAMNLVRGKGMKNRPVWLAKTRAEQARCTACGELYGDHRPIPPHVLRSRGCVGFVLPTAEVAC